MDFGNAFRLVWVLYETILSAVPLERGEGSGKQAERTQHHQFDFALLT